MTDIFNGFLKQFLWKQKPENREDEDAFLLSIIIMSGIKNYPSSNISLYLYQERKSDSQRGQYNNREN